MQRATSRRFAFQNAGDWAPDDSVSAKASVPPVPVPESVTAIPQ